MKNNVHHLKINVNIKINIKKRSINFIYFDQSDDWKFFVEVFNKTKFLKISNGQMWITDNFNKYPCVFHAIKFDIENETVRNSLIDLLIYFIKHEHQRIQKIPDVSGIIAGDYSLRTSHDEKAIIFDIINHMLYNKEDCNVISLVALIVFEINSNHLYSNGNKRTSVATMASVLSYFGYYLYFSATKNEKMFDLWEKTMCNIANYKNVKFLQTKEKTIKYIKSKITENVLIDIRDRKLSKPE